MGSHGVTGPPLARAEDQDDGERGKTRVDLDDRATGKVQDATMGQPTSRAEDPVGQWGVDGHSPHSNQYDKGRELDAISRSATDERGRDDGEHHLIGQHRK